ncbi:MAG: hypothetical protein CM15mP18_3760 [Methanobacteriota archaeon]|nr:MAG: hypothetical protein CM15mP18_3760 [Euryarchaeota archaeon]
MNRRRRRRLQRPPLLLQQGLHAPFAPIRTLRTQTVTVQRCILTHHFTSKALRMVLHRPSRRVVRCPSDPSPACRNDDGPPKGRQVKVQRRHVPFAVHFITHVSPARRARSSFRKFGGRTPAGEDASFVPGSEMIDAFSRQGHPFRLAVIGQRAGTVPSSSMTRRSRLPRR